ncbi:MAG: hypothetical protein M3M99_02940, partial [Actinomycetota bacterium]|nr:hypothetical protein [Actinomycetota bacterium]
VGAGPSEAHERAKAALRGGERGAPRALIEAAWKSADSAGMRNALADAADSIGFAAEHLFDRG